MKRNRLFGETDALTGEPESRFYADRATTEMREPCYVPFSPTRLPESGHITETLALMVGPLAEMLRSPSCSQAEHFRILSEVTESLFSGHCSHQSPELEALGEKIEQLAKKIDVLLTREGAIVVPVQTFTPEPFDVLKEIPVVVRPQEDGSYVASFFDAAICMSGDNPEEAVQNLKEFMLGLYEDYLAEGEEVLGQEPLRQWKVLKEFIRRRE